MIKRIRITLLALVLCGSLSRAEDSSQAEIPLEAKVKAAFLFNFARFVEWPTTVEPGRPLVIGVLGVDSLTPYVKTALDGQMVAGRPIAVTEMSHFDSAQKVDILYMAESEAVKISSVIQALDGAPVLTVGESRGFIEKGGMIRFLNQNNRVRFVVNLPAIQKSSLKVSSQMLQYAQVQK